MKSPIPRLVRSVLALTAERMSEQARSYAGMASEMRRAKVSGTTPDRLDEQARAWAEAAKRVGKLGELGN